MFRAVTLPIIMSFLLYIRHWYMSSVPNVQWKTHDDGQRNCPKHVEFLDKNKFGKLMRLFVLL